MHSFHRLLGGVVFALLISCNQPAKAWPGPIIVTHAIRATGWSPKVVLFGAERERVKRTPILLRKNRPFHFYGNTLRRIHYRRLAMGR